MARMYKNPVTVPPGVRISFDGLTVHAKGPAGENEMRLHEDIECLFEADSIQVKQVDGHLAMLAGTMRSLLQNLVSGVRNKFFKKLNLVGVGYKAQLEGSRLELNLGYSHPIYYDVPPSVHLEIPGQKEIVISGVDKQKVGQVAADIRKFRPPEPYRGKGVHVEGEVLIRKEVRKK